MSRSAKAYHIHLIADEYDEEPLAVAFRMINFDDSNSGVTSAKDAAATAAAAITVSY